MYVSKSFSASHFSFQLIDGGERKYWQGILRIKISKDTDENFNLFVYFNQ